MGKRKLTPQEKQRAKRDDQVKAQFAQDTMEQLRTDGKLRDRFRRILDALPPWDPFVDVTDHLSSPLLRKMGLGGKDLILKVQERMGTGNKETRAFQNSRYFVHRTPHPQGGWTLSIRNLVNDARHDWREFQRIKNELCGPECEGFELYPAEDRLVDTSNQFYMHVMPPGMRLPVGFDSRLVMKPRTDRDPTGTNQRPWEPGSEPVDAVDPPPPDVDALVYLEALAGLNKETDGGEDSEPEGDRVLPGEGGTEERPGEHDGRGDGVVGGQPGERREEGQGGRAVGEGDPVPEQEDHGGDREVRGRGQAGQEDQWVEGQVHNEGAD